MATVRELHRNELGLVTALAHRTWPVSYAGIISRDQIDYMLSKMYDQQQLEADFLKGIHFDILEEANEELGFAGHGLKQGDPKIYRLEKLYVLPERQGLGLGKLLLSHVIEKAKDASATTLQLNVNKQNNAYQFYLRNGFTVAFPEVTDIGAGYVMDDFVMQLPLALR